MVGVVAPDGVEVVVLARNAQTLLRVHRAGVGAGFSAQKDIFELHHTGVGEKQRAIASRNERSAGHDGVPSLSEKVEERLTNLIAGKVHKMTPKKLG